MRAVWPASRLADSSNSVVELRADNSFAQMIARGEREREGGGVEKAEKGCC